MLLLLFPEDELSTLFELLSYNLLIGPARKAISPSGEIEAREAQRVGAVDVPRGILYHMYAFDMQGRITRAAVLFSRARIMATYSSLFKS
ncbi:hypothetical protein [Desulfopila sp. IMCC35008]|uniref:hypothetical protein n=1 Tax=Desulfopila sp. IMCC35008 TaxID=2653858 RepID=UPI0013D22594|nr:hypothetical protein [Desulfopila sp. IMCC35008]